MVPWKSPYWPTVVKRSMVDTLRHELKEATLTRISIAATALLIAFDVASADVAFLPV